MMTLYLVRHGETELGRAGRYSGESDPPLDEVGAAMARALAQGYAGERFDALYASPQRRALETIAPLALHLNQTVAPEPRLCEMRYGAWDQLTAAEIRERDAERFAAWESDPARVAPPGGETAVEVAARALPAIADLRRRHAGGCVLVLSHKTTIRVLLCSFLGIDVRLHRRRFAMPLGAINVIEFAADGDARLVRLADRSYLPPDLLVAAGAEA